MTRRWCLCVVLVAGCSSEEDGGTDAALSQTAQGVLGQNDAPVLDTSKSPTLPNVAEDSGAPGAGSGGSVGFLVDETAIAGQLDNYTDLDRPENDPDTQPGIALVHADLSDGTWYYSIDGTSWTAVGNVSETNALLLPNTARLAIQPNPNVARTLPDVVGFRGWDQTSGTTGTYVDVSTTFGGTTAFSTEIDYGTLTVTNVNDAPVLDASKTVTLNNVNEDATAPSGAVGTLVSALVDYGLPIGNVTDVDDGAQLGIGITAVDSTNGTWYFTLNNGIGWSTIGSIGTDQVFLITAETGHRLYFRPNANFSGTVTNAITFRAWDRTAGFEPNITTFFGTGGTNAISAATDTASITVTNINDAPFLDVTKTPVMAPIAKNSPTPSGAVGTLLSTLIDPVPPAGGLDNFTDVDGNPVGVALVAANQTNGAWWITTDGGTSWSSTGGLTTSNAMLLSVTPLTRITFVPNTNFVGQVVAALTIRAWDGTTGTSESFVPISSVGGSTAYSAGSDTIDVLVVGDAPMASNLSAPETYTEDTALDLVDIVVSDTDSANLTVTLALSSPGVGTLTTATSGATTSTFDSGTGVWQASGPIANVNTLLAGVMFMPAANSSQSFTIATSVSDGNNPPLTGTKTVTGTAVNDAPQATNLSAPDTYVEDNQLDLTDIVVADPDSSVTVTLTLSSTSVGTLTTATAGSTTSMFSAGVWTASGPVAEVNTLLAGVAFSPAANANGNFTIATSVTDGVAAPVTGTKAMTGMPLNDPPTGTNRSSGEFFTEETPLDLIDIVVGDIDSANLTVTLTLGNIAAGTLSTATSGSTTSTFAAGVWTATGPIAELNTLLAGVVFTPATNYYAAFQLQTSISDGVTNLTGTKQMIGTNVNDAPTATNMNAPETYTEDTSLDLVDIVVTDPDPSAGVSVQLVMSNTAAGSFNTPTSGSVTPTFTAGTGTWFASGPVADINTILAALTFTPAANSTAAFTLSVAITDGIAAPISGSKAFTGSAVATPPTATNLSAPETMNEDETLNLVDIVITDPDSASVTATLGLSDPAAGTLSATTMTGTVASVNAQLAAVTFSPSANYNTALTITTSVSDGTTTLTGSKPVTITAVNDAPTAVGDIADVNPGSTIDIDVLANDTDVDGETPTITIVTAPAHGTASVANGRITYAHDNSTATSDTIVYQLNDAAGATSNTATVTLTIIGPDEPHEDGGCGCQSTSPTSASWMLLVLGLVLRRRRR